MAMLYEMVRYPTIEAFNADAEQRYNEVMAERTPNSYDRFWKAESVVFDGPLHLTVLWSKVAPLRKR
jgi:hypothetical protein